MGTDVRSLLQQAASRLGERADAEALLLHLLGKPRSWLFAHTDDALDDTMRSAYDALLDRREKGEPIAYITGSRGFWSMELEVSPATLIPRPETELLVELALARLPEQANCRIADLGTGSGAIALAIASERSQAAIVATDASLAALEIAQRNARNLRLPNVAFMHGDWLGPLGGQHFDLIVSNPPYIESGDPHLQQGDLRFEPSTALVSGADGLDDIRHIAGTAFGHLVAGGWLMFEHGWNQGSAIRCLLEQLGYADVFTAQDLERRDRVTGARWC